MKKMLTPLEDERIVKFMTKHKDCHRGMLEGRWAFTVKLDTRGIGVGVRVKCCSCGKKKNVSDYDSW